MAETTADLLAALAADPAQSFALLARDGGAQPASDGAWAHEGWGDGRKAGR